MSIIINCRRLALSVRKVSLKTPLQIKISKFHHPSTQYAVALDLRNYSQAYKERKNTINHTYPEDILRRTPRLMEELNKSEIDFKNLPNICEYILNENEQQTKNVGKLFQSFCARYIHAEKRVDHAIQMFNYLKTLNPEDIQPGTYAILMGCFRGTGKKYEKVILEIYEKLKDYSDMFPTLLLPYISDGLCETTKWKEALDLIEMEKFQTSDASVPLWKPILIRSIKEGDADITSFLLDGIIHVRKLGENKRMAGLINELFQLVKDNQVEFNMKDFCDILEIMRIQPDKSLAENILNYFNEEMPQWNCVATSLGQRQTCLDCGHRLPQVKISQNEMDGLQDQILNKLIYKSDVYLNSDPQEVEKFLKMVKREGPFDIVFDGCNVATGKFKRNSILTAIEYFKYEKRMNKILVICRNHIMKKNRSHENKAIFFPVDNKSKDDLFVLYAACQSPDTYVMSHDMFSNHVHGGIDREYFQVFFKWILHRQIRFFNFMGDKVWAKFPTSTDLVPSYTNNMYHIPYMNDERIYWLCAKKKP